MLVTRTIDQIRADMVRDRAEKQAHDDSINLIIQALSDSNALLGDQYRINGVTPDQHFEERKCICELARESMAMGRFPFTK